MRENYVIGIDIGGTNFRIGAVSEEGRVVHFRKVSVKEVFCTEDALGDLTGYLKTYCELLKEEGKQTEAVAIGFPATLNKERTVVLQAPNVAFMENLPVVEVLSQELGIPVVIERDVCMALYYDQKKYALEDAEVLAGCYYGTGLGNAVMIDGKMLLGKHGTAGELGHIPVDGSQMKCGCGNIGCMENVGAGKYLAYLCQEEYKDTKVENMFTEHGEEPLLRQFVDRMAMAAATEVNILDPDYLLIGGGVPFMQDFPRNYLVEKILYWARKPYPAQDLQIIFAEDEEDKCVVGAAVYARRTLEL